jgi:hypothetical protein
MSARAGRGAGLLLAPIVLVFAAISVTPAFGATEVALYAVPSGGDTTVGSSDCQAGQPACALSLALHQSNDGSLNNDAVVINLAAGTYSDEPVLNVNNGEPSTLTFDGAGSASTVMDGDGTTRKIFRCPQRSRMRRGSMSCDVGGDCYPLAAGDFRLVGVPRKPVENGSGSKEVEPGVQPPWTRSNPRRMDR